MFIKTILVSVLTLSAFVAQAEEFDSVPVVKSITKTLQTNKGVNQTIKTTLDTMIQSAVRELRKRDHDEAANRIEGEWKRYFKHLTAFLSQGRSAVGDHAPLSQWLIEVSTTLEDALGAKLMRKTHLDDIKIFNYTIPVVIDPKNQEWDKTEFGVHFVPFAGSAAFWGVRLSCKATPAGAFPFVCSTAGRAGEHIMRNYIAEDLGDTLYDNAN